jgi:hypothetical protein
MFCALKSTLKTVDRIFFGGSNFGVLALNTCFEMLFDVDIAAV